jgi:hypothetical protein
MIAFGTSLTVMPDEPDPGEALQIPPEFPWMLTAERWNLAKRCFYELHPYFHSIRRFHSGKGFVFWLHSLSAHANRWHAGQGRQPYMFANRSKYAGELQGLQNQQQLEFESPGHTGEEAISGDYADYPLTDKCTVDEYSHSTSMGRMEVR